MMLEDDTAMVAHPMLVIDYAKKGGVFRGDADDARRFAPNVWRGCVRWLKFHLVAAHPSPHTPLRYACGYGCAGS